MGVSSGGWAALAEILPALPADFPMPVVVVQHLHPQQDDFFLGHLNDICALRVKIADEKELLRPGHVYFAPPNYHLLIEKDRTFSLSVDQRVNFSRPAIDVLFESGAEVYSSRLVGVILTGANADGAHGLKQIKDGGGLAIVQDPATAQIDYMPRAAMAAVAVDHVLPLTEIGPFLARLGRS
ncbi:MAG: chemotaxis protein CheB [Desulfobulbaceae bacterium]|nr:chemotaxis protein CheB [Desulfobulbaceae bacterium]